MTTICKWEKEIETLGLWFIYAFFDKTKPVLFITVPTSVEFR